MPLKAAGVDLDEIEALVDAALVEGRAQEQVEARALVMFTPWSTWKALIAEVRTLREAIAIRDAIGESGDEW